MTTEKKHDSAGGLTRRGVLQAGLAAAALGAVGTKSDLVAQDQPQGPGNVGVQAIDIHAHYQPESYSTSSIPKRASASARNFG